MRHGGRSTDAPDTRSPLLSGAPAGGVESPWPELTRHALPDGNVLLHGELPGSLRLDEAGFGDLWNQHPAEYPRILIHGRYVATPRWTQGYGRPYYDQGTRATIERLPPSFEPVMAAARDAIDGRLNTIHVNWYDAALRHYIGPHRDHRGGLVPGAPIVTISAGADRVFRLRPWRGKGRIDFAARDGTVFVIPYATNLAWTHEVPHRARDRGRRISITLRALLPE